MNKTKGILVFARNNSQVDYIKQAYFLAKRAQIYLDLPTTVVTDSVDFLKNQYPDWNSVFDKIVPIVWEEDKLVGKAVLSPSENKNLKKFHDGSLVSKQLAWKNESRVLAYEASPYDETLVLDTDVIICNNEWLKCFKQQHDLLLYKHSTELIDIDRGDDLERISDTSVDFYWATCVFFRKTETNKIFFGLVQHIQENWSHYLYFASDRSVLWQIQGESLFVLLEKPLYDGEYTPLKVKNCNLHFMNKFSLNRCIDEL